MSFDDKKYLLGTGVGTGTEVAHAVRRCCIARCRLLAFVEGRDFCLPDDFKQLIVPVFAHRVIVNTRYVSTQKKSQQAEAILR